jgi:hypothetical protein
MTYEEYCEKLKSIDWNCHAQKEMLLQRFIDRNNFYKPGDIVVDEDRLIKVEVRLYALSADGVTSECVYQGVEVGNDLRTKISHRIVEVFHKNISRGVRK